MSLTVTDETGKERTITECALTWYKVRPTIHDFLTGYPVRLFGQLALAESLSGESRRNTLKSVFRRDHEEVFRAYKMLIHNCFTEKGFHIPDGVLTSDTYANNVLIARPTGENAINIAAIDEKFTKWIQTEIENKPLTRLQIDVYQYLFPNEESSERGSQICQLITVLFLIDGTFEETRDDHNVHNRYMNIFGEIFPEELPPEADTVITREDIFVLLYRLRNSLKSLSMPGNIELRFVNNKNVFDVFVENNEISSLVIYANEFYKKLVGHIYAWESANRANPNYMPNRIMKSFEFDA